MANMQTDEENNLKIFLMSTGTNEPTKEVMNKKLVMIKRFQVNVKDIKCPLEWWAKHKSLFPIVAFLARHILGIIVFQIKIEKKKSLVGIFTNLRRCHLQSNNLNKIIFVSKN
jgi:hypothetical protein